MNNKKYVITITRQFGSLGRPIAKLMAKELGIEYYDRDIVDEAAKQLKLPASVIDEEEESAKKTFKNPFSRMVFPLGGGTSNTQDDIFEAQQNIIRFLAEKNSCIIVGRCSDFMLSEMENVINIFIYALQPDRVDNCVKSMGLEINEAKKMIVAVDEARDSYHMNYAGYLPGDRDHSDILINSSLLGVEGTAQYLAELIKRKFEL